MVYGTSSNYIKPLLGVVLTLFGSSPTVIFSRFAAFSNSAQRGLLSTFTPKGLNAGVLELRYPAPPPQALLGLWFGPIEYAFEVTKQVAERVDASFVSPAVIQFELSWPAT